MTNAGRRGPEVVLIVDDNEDDLHLMGSYFRRWVIRYARGVADATTHVRSLRRLDLALIDLELLSDDTQLHEPWPDGFKVVDDVRTSFPSATIVVVTRFSETRLINHAAEQGATYVVKADFDEALTKLARLRISGTVGLDTFVLQLANAHRLSTRHVEVLSLSLRGYKRHEIAEQLGLADSTVKDHVSTIVRRCRVRNIDDIARRYRGGPATDSEPES